MGDYPAAFFRQRPVEFDGKKVAGANLLNKPFANPYSTGVLDAAVLRTLRKQVGQVQEARLKVIRCNELDNSADFQANLAAAQTTSTRTRLKMGVLVEELSAAGVYFMPSMFDRLWGLDQNAAVRAAMPGGFPMFGATSLYQSLIPAQVDDSFGANDKGSVRRFLVNMATYGDGGTYQSANSGAKPGPNRTTALGLGGDALIDAIWAFVISDHQDFLTSIDWGNPDLLIWLQNGNGPETPAEETLDVFLPFGYFGNSKLDLKQAAGNAVATSCGVFCPTTASEGSAEARDQLYHARKTWADKVLSDLAYGDIDTENVILSRSLHAYREGTFDSRLAGDPITANGVYTEIGISARFRTEHRASANGDRDGSMLADQNDADHVFYIEIRQGVQAILSSNGGLNTVTVAANPTSAQLRDALKTLPGIGDNGAADGHDLTVRFVHDPDPAQRGRMPYTRFTDPAGIQFRGYEVRLGGISGPSTDTKSKRKKGVDITSAQSSGDVRIYQWVKGGVVDRGAGLMKFTKWLVEHCGAEIIMLHAPLETRGYHDDYWTYGPRGTAGTYEARRIIDGRYRIDLSAWAMCDTEPNAYNFFWNWFGRYMESLNQ